MKKKLILIIYIAVASVVTSGLQSCKKGLEELNDNPDQYNEPIPDYLFTSAQLRSASINFSASQYRLIGGALQYFSTYKEVPASGDKYFNFNGSVAAFEQYTGAINQLQEIIDNVSDPELVNKLSAARIMRVYNYHILTDQTGDIPYFEGAKGILTPKYDTQQAIYNDMFKELEEAALAFDPQKPTFASADLFYGGDVVKWKKFAYSLMLRLGMRLTKVDPDLARSWVEKAIAGGVITTNADIARIQYADGSLVSNRNPKSNDMLGGDFVNPQDPDNIEGSKYAETFINHLKSTADPRLNIWSVVWTMRQGATSYSADTSTAIQKGMKNAAFNSRPADFATYSEPHPVNVLSYAAPILVLTASEMHLLLAEAAIRGWYSGNAATEYGEAVRSAMGQLSLFGPSAIIPSDKIEGYLAANPFNSAGTFEQQLEQISTQKWVSLFLDFYEVFSNWRRTGYPALTPTNYPGNVTGGQIFRRFTVPITEDIRNQANFQESLTRQGYQKDNDILSRVWWDRP